MRIVSICPSNTEIAWALGLGGEIVGIDDYSDWPPELQHLPRVGSDLAVDLDAIRALRPDLVLASLTVPGMERNVEALRAAGIPHWVSDPKDPTGILQEIRELAALTGRREAGERLVAELEARTAALRARVAGLAPVRVFWDWWPSPLMTPGRDNWLTAVTRWAGGENVFADQPGPQVRPRHEEVVARAPEVILACWPGVPTEKIDVRRIAGRPGWDRIPAVREGRIHVVEEGLYCRPSQRLWDGAEALVALLHPEAA
ncbi:cobalamin-binding protein [Caldinitratiruptor microaerophilus]|uniref:cobalamin-binding protein n=1 Tax=Caldinitratiruptor microaerophilus TaxID=671077 RepID=UPI00222FC3EC|nr:cobalamin-binding protein [Caldinitratiruptor microaerophilus]